MTTKGYPVGLCQCGCGGKTKPARQNDSAKGYVKGEPMRFVHGHKSPRTPYRVDANGCWIWQLQRNKSGYGRKRVDGRLLLAHRLYYERDRGPIPEGLQLDHLCRNRACVNPEHLEIVTPAENSRRGTQTKLTADEVERIKESNEPAPDLAETYGVHLRTIYKVRAGETWVG